MTQPYRRLYATLRARAARDTLATTALVLVVSAVLVPLVRPVFMSFLDDPDIAVADGLREVWIRASAIALVSMGLAVHGTVLRGGARAVLALHPVDPVAVVWQELGVAVRGQVPLIVGLWILLTPIAVSVGVGAWALGLLVIAGGAFVSLTGSAVAFLGAVEAAESPRWAPLLDSLRGNNPRPQAALMYALVPVTVVGGWSTMQAAEGAANLWAGQPGGALSLALPWVAGLAALPMVPRVAARNWFRASLVLADIRARYDAVIDPLEARRVAWDWTLGRLPDPVAREALAVLRYGWRVRRTLLSAGWVLAAGALFAVWRDDAGAPVRAGLLAGATGWLTGLAALQGTRAEPAFLVVWLDRRDGARALGAVWALLCWSSSAVAVAAAASLIRHGLPGLLSTTALAVGGVAAASIATALAVSRRSGVASYGAAALLTTAATAAWILGRVP